MPLRFKPETRPLAWFVEPDADGISRYLGRDPAEDQNPEVIIPPNQRLYVWPLEKQQTLIDSVLRGLPINAIYLAVKRTRGRTIYQVEEGQQRLETLWRFRNGRFSYNGRTFAELSDEDKEQFLSYPMMLLDITNASDDTLSEIFDRVNTGVALKDGEKFYNYRKKPLVALAERLLLTPGTGLHAEATARWGDYMTRKNKRRDNHANAVALIAGAAYGSSYLTKSYVKICKHLDGYYDGTTVTPINEALVESRLRSLLDVYRQADEMQDTTAQERGSHWPVGKTSAYILHSLISCPADEIALRKEIWVRFLAQCRLDKKTAGILYLEISKSNNLTESRLQKGWENVYAWAERDMEGEAEEPGLVAAAAAYASESEEEDE